MTTTTIPAAPPTEGTVRPARKALAAARIALGFVFFWAFLDKTFGLGYSTPSAKAWIHGGSPTRGFLSHVYAGPLQSTLRSWAGSGPVDLLFMLGLLGIGVALILGIGLRLAAVSGVVLMGLMWTAVWPPAQTTSTGLPTGSNNPVADDHVIYALLLIALAMAHAGDTWGLARLWARLPLVNRLPWLR